MSSTGYTRQSSAQIVTGSVIQASDFNNEYNQLQSAFDGTIGHDHSGGAGLSQKIGLTNAVTGILPAANGGTGIANSSTITLGGNLTLSGAFTTTLTVTSGTTLTLPITGTLSTLAGSETLTNKTLTAPVIATIVNSGTLTLPTSTDTLIGRATTDTLTNKTLTAPVIATIVNSGTLTLPTTTDTLVGRATTDTLTNKTLTSPTINGATLTTPALGVATATSINGLTITTTTGTLTIANGKTLTVNNSLTLVGTDATTITFQGTDTYVGRATTDTLTNKTFDSAGTGNALKVNGTSLTSVTGSGSVALSASPTFTGTVNAAAITSSGINTAASFVPTSSTPPTVGMYLSSAGILGFASNSVRSFEAFSPSFAVNWMQIGSNTAGNYPFFQAEGSDTNVGLTFTTKGTGNVFFLTGGGYQVEITDTVGVTNRLLLTGSATNPTISTSGGDLALNSNSGHVTAPTESAGDNSTRVATTAFVTAATPFTKSFQSTAITMTAGSGGTIAHSLGGRPKIIYAYIRNLTAELNYAIGDEVPFPIEVNNFGVNAWSDGTTNIRYWIATGFRLPNATTGSDNAITYANWQLFIRAYA